MTNEILTMKSEKFGKVRLIFEGDKTLYCAADVTNALGYSNGKDAIKRHCRWVVKRDLPHPQSPNKRLEASFLPEADVYRLICHSKLPSALEFEKWVFEDVVPKAVDDKLNAEPEQLTLETSEYHYFKKTYNGEPVITLDDFEHFTEVSRNNVYRYVKRMCKPDVDYLHLKGAELFIYKTENRGVNKLSSEVIILKANAVRKLLKYFGLSVEIPMIEQKKPVALPASRREYVLKREPSKAMKSLIEHLHNEIKAIEGISYMLLCPDTKDNHENQREQLVKRIRALRDYSFDVSTILIE